jgi:hypothetical protein
MEPCAQCQTTHLVPGAALADDSVGIEIGCCALQLDDMLCTRVVTPYQECQRQGKVPFSLGQPHREHARLRRYYDQPFVAFADTRMRSRT